MGVKSNRPDLVGLGLGGGVGGVVMEREETRIRLKFQVLLTRKSWFLDRCQK